MMNGVGDGVHQLATDGRGNQRCLIDRVIYLAANVDGAIEKCRRDRLKGVEDALRFGQRELAIVFDSRITVAMVVIYLIGVEPVEQALKMIETMPGMSANGGLEGRAHFLRIFVVVDLAQKRFPLAQDFDDGGV